MQIRVHTIRLRTIHLPHRHKEIEQADLVQNIQFPLLSRCRLLPFPGWTRRLPVASGIPAMRYLPHSNTFILYSGHDDWSMIPQWAKNQVTRGKYVVAGIVNTDEKTGRSCLPQRAESRAILISRISIRSASMGRKCTIFSKILLVEFKLLIYSLSGKK